MLVYGKVEAKNPRSKGRISERLLRIKTYLVISFLILSWSVMPIQGLQTSSIVVVSKGMIKGWELFYLENFETGELVPQGNITFHSEIVRSGETVYERVAELDSTIGYESIRSLRVFSLAEKGIRSYGFALTEIPPYRYLKWNMMIRFESLGNTVEPIEFELNIEEASKGKSTDLIFAYVPINVGVWDGSGGDQWTAYSPNGSWIEIGHHKLETGRWYNITATVDLSDNPAKDFVLTIDNEELNRIPRFNSGSLANYGDVMTAGVSIASYENITHYLNVDSFAIYIMP